MILGDAFSSDGMRQTQVCFEAWGSGQRGNREGVVGPKMPCYGERRRGMSGERGRKPQGLPRKPVITATIIP